MIQVNVKGYHNLLAIPVGIKQKDNVDKIIQKVYHITLAVYSICFCFVLDQGIYRDLYFFA